MTAHAVKSVKLLYRCLSVLPAILMTSAVIPCLAQDGEDTTEVVLFEEKFEDTQFEDRGWYDSPSIIRTTAEHIAGSKYSSIWKWVYAGDITAAARGGRVLIEPVEGLTLSFHIKFSPHAFFNF